jgi:uncharacterized protein (TIGR03437 family)
MPLALLTAALAWGPLLTDLGCNGATPDSSYPCYSAASIANSAAGVANYYAPNTFISIYGQSLAVNTVSISAEDLSGGTLPIALIGANVVVLINNIPAYMWYVSPTLVNVLIPANLIAGPATLQLEVDGKYGPPAAINLSATAPALFQTDATTILGTHADYSLVTASSPAQPGEVIVLWATGLGPTLPPVIPNQVPRAAAPLAAMSEFQVFLNGEAVDPSLIYYAGATPTCAGLYQINVRLPNDAPADPEVRIAASGVMSPPGRFLSVE